LRDLLKRNSEMKLKLRHFSNKKKKSNVNVISRLSRNKKRKRRNSNRLKRRNNKKLKKGGLKRKKKTKKRLRRTI
jgi:hypothetical protein